MAKLKQQQFKIGDRCRIKNDWLPIEAKAREVIITKLRDIDSMKGTMAFKQKFAEVKWTGRNSTQFTENCGTMFPVDELEKV